MVKVIGVLALQGAFAKHEATIRKLGEKPLEVRKARDLFECDALIIPGGESTVIFRQLDIGKLTKEDELQKSEFWQRDLETIAWKFATWTRETYPDKAASVEVAMEKRLSSIFGRPFTFANSTPPPRKRKH